MPQFRTLSEITSRLVATSSKSSWRPEVYLEDAKILPPKDSCREQAYRPATRS